MVSAGRVVRYLSGVAVATATRTAGGETVNEFDWMLFGCVVVLALAGSYVTGQNRVLVGVVEMWKRRCEDRAARIASLEQTVAWLKSELGATEGEAQDVERWR